MKIWPLLAGDDGTAQTIEQIRLLVDDAWKDSVVHRAAVDIIRAAGVQPYDSAGQVRAIYEWVRQNIYFVNDPVSKEALWPANDLLEMRAGDCDDINATLLPALLGAIGFETRLVTIAADRRAPENFSHIYAEVDLDGRWIPIDAARPGAQFGVAPPNFYRRAWWSLTDGEHDEYPNMAGLGFVARTNSRELLRGLAGYSDPAANSAVPPAIGPGGAMLLVSPRPNDSACDANCESGEKLIAVGLLFAFGLWLARGGTK